MSVSGIIAIWSGSIVTIPSGWVICDGNNGTPDLRNNFVVGAGDTYAVDANGGNVLHFHGFSGDGHVHLMQAGSDILLGDGYNANTGANAAAGNTDNANGLPPYYALAFIMKT